MAGIIGYGLYIPKFRLKQEDAAKAWGGWSAGEKAVCGADEDIVTMAAEASQKAIAHAGVNPSEIGAIYIGTCSSPYIEQYVAPILAETLELGPEATVVDYCGSLNAGAMALQACLDALAAKRIKCGLVIATENRATTSGSGGEVGFGCGAAAFVIGTKDTIADIEGMHNYTTLFIDRWRAVTNNFVTDNFDIQFDRQYGFEAHILAATKGLLKKLDKKAEDFTQVVLQQPDARLPGLAAKSIGIKPDKMALGTIVNTLGDLGSASTFVGLAGVLDKAKPGDKILVVSYGSGSSSAVSLAVGAGIGKRERVATLEKYLKRKQYIDYVTYLKLAGTIKHAPY